MNTLEYDYVILGGGTAGCVMANRLTAGGKYTVALIEAGGYDDWVWYHIPVGYLFAIGNPRSDWLYKTENDAGLNGRSINYARGKVIGGSSSINAMIYMRGQAADYDGWGVKGWSWNDCLPAFNKPLSHFKYGHDEMKPWRVEYPRMTWKILDDFGKAASEFGIPASDDFNMGDNEGYGYFHLNQKNGRRWSATRGYIRPIAGRKNFKLFTMSHADKLTMEEKTVTGVIVKNGGENHHVKAKREVIVSLGAIATPAFLERSGIGNPLILNKLGIETKHELKGVGENLQDHLQLRLIYKVEKFKTMNQLSRNPFMKLWWGLQYLFARRGPLTLAPSQFGVFTRSSSKQNKANIQFHIQPLSLEKFGDPLHKFNAITVSVCNIRPSSRGSVHARSQAPLDKPIITPNYLSTDDDKQIAIESIKVAREIMKQPALAHYSPVEYLPGDKYTDLVKAAGDIGTTIFHPVGTCKMGDENDEMAVVDDTLRIHGLKNIRVVDASVMPKITSGNTNSPTLMIAERAAEMVMREA